MLSDSFRLRTLLARQQCALSEWEVVEAAEKVVRAYHRGLLANELETISRELDDARRHLSVAHAGGDLQLIAVAQAELVTVQRTARILRRLSREHELACTKARAAYLTGQRQLLETINGLQRLILRTAEPPA